MAKMRVVQVPKPGTDFEVVEREIPEPARGHVRIRVQACGICHSDVITKELEAGRTRRRRLAWRPGRNLRGMQERRLRELREREGLWN